MGIRFRSHSGELANGVLKTKRFPNIPLGWVVTEMTISVQDLTFINVSGIDNLEFTDDSNGVLRKGLVLGGNLYANRFELRLPKSDLEIKSIPTFELLQNTGVDFNYAIILVISSPELAGR